MPVGDYHIALNENTVCKCWTRLTPHVVFSQSVPATIIELHFKEIQLNIFRHSLTPVMVIEYPFETLVVLDCMVIYHNLASPVHAARRVATPGDVGHFKST
jgi:hypothetical protein